MMRLPRRRAAIALSVGLVVIAAAAGLGYQTTNSSRPAPALARPNIILVLTDDQSLESVPHMPFVSGRSDWVNFEKSFINVALCCPSRASILTGQYSHHTHVEDNLEGFKLQETETFATWLKAAGYRTALLGKYLNFYPWRRGPYVPPGWDEWHAFQGEARFYNYTLNENGNSVRYGAAPQDYSTDVLSRKATSFIAGQAEPFLLVVAPNAPHDPRAAAPRHQQAFADMPMPRPASFNEAHASDKPAWVRTLPGQPPEAMDRFRREQYRSLLGVDDMVREIFAALEKRKALDNTVVFFTTDNGYTFGEHRHTGKFCAYEECIRTPLLVRYPGQDERKVEALVQNVDLASTFAQLAGVTPRTPQDGRSLVQLLRNEREQERTELLLHWAGHAPGISPDPNAGPVVTPFWGIRTERYKYLELATGEKELYDLRSDPYELDNRAGDPSSARTLADLASRLARLRGPVGPR
jgi:N-acetylglucosamine-6-sulfatase